MLVATQQKQIDNAVRRLEQNLPLRYNQVRLPQALRQLHQAECHSCAESLCTEMMFIAGKDEASYWQAEVESRSDRELFDLNTAKEMINRILLPLMR